MKKADLKIIHLVLGKANPNRMNGVNKVAYQLATTQTRLGYDTCLWGIANSVEHNYPERNFKTELFLQYKNKWAVNSELRNAITVLPPETVVHIHGAFIPTFYRISRLLKTQGIPYIYTPHGSFMEMAMEKNKRIKQIYFKLFEKKIIKDAKRIQLLGIHEFEYLDELTKYANKCLIPNGQDMSELPGYQAVDGIAGVPVFGFCGRLATYHKGLDLMLKGFHRYLKNGGEGQLELIGDGKDRPDLTALAQELAIDKKVIFHGKKFGKEKFDLLQGMDVFLHTSRMEGFPTAVLEAAALRKPCITSEATNMNSYIEQYNAGFILQKNTPEEIAEKMEKAAKGHELKKLSRLGENAHRMVTEVFDWEIIAERLVKEYTA